MVLDGDLIFGFSEVLSDNLTTDFLAFWPNSYSGKILLWPSWTAEEGFEVDSTDGGFLKVDGFLNETFLSSEFSAGFSSDSSLSLRSFNWRKKSKAAREFDLSDNWSLETSERSYFLYLLGLTTWSGVLLGPLNSRIGVVFLRIFGCLI